MIIKTEGKVKNKHGKDTENKNLRNFEIRSFLISTGRHEKQNKKCYSPVRKQGRGGGQPVTKIGIFLLKEKDAECSEPEKYEKKIFCDIFCKGIRPLKAFPNIFICYPDLSGSTTKILFLCVSFLR